MQKLSAARLHLDVRKSKFSIKKTKYLGFIIKASKGISIDLEKVAAIKAQEPLKLIKGICSFIRFANFYRQFIRNFLAIIEPLTKLTRKNAVFKQNQPQQTAFNTLKKCFAQRLALANFNLELKIVLECNTSRQATRGVLLQYRKDSLLHAVAYYLSKNSKSKVNYTIYNKELLVVIKCLLEQLLDLKQLSYFTVITNYKNLEYFCKARLLLECYVCQAGILSKYNLTFMY